MREGRGGKMVCGAPQVARRGGSKPPNKVILVDMTFFLLRCLVGACLSGSADTITSR
jgi:hypothetical protein